MLTVKQNQLLNYLIMRIEKNGVSPSPRQRIAFFLLCCLILFAQVETASHSHEADVESHIKCKVCHYVSYDEEAPLSSFTMLLDSFVFIAKSVSVAPIFTILFFYARSRAPPFI